MPIVYRTIKAAEDRQNGFSLTYHEHAGAISGGSAPILREAIENAINVEQHSPSRRSTLEQFHALGARLNWEEVAIAKAGG
ncbi:MAG TPA: hypothetical protein VGM73_16290 [Candidatus Didemnitutus sp.]|jgi:hypothetical protein